MKEVKEADDLAARVAENERIRAQEELNAKGDDANKIIVYPQYELDERLMVYRECQQPPADLFIGLGWDEDQTTKRKHYRQYYRDELEKVKDIFLEESPFDTFKLFKGEDSSMKRQRKLYSFKRTHADAKKAAAADDSSSSDDENDQ